MGFLDFLKKKAPVAKQQPQAATKAEPNSFGERFDRLTPEGELPWGWHTYTKEFTDKINGEYSHFLNAWLDSRNKSPLDQYAALKSFVMYLEDVERLCRSKGECYEFWFNEILTSAGYLQKRKSELENLKTKLEKCR